MCRPLYFLSLAILWLIPQTTTAALITYSASFGPQQFSLGTQVGGSVGSGSSSTLNWNASLGINFTFPQFDPNLGALNDVRISFSGATGLTADIRFANNQSPPFNIAGINVNMTTNAIFNDATLTVSSNANNFLNNTITATSSATPFNFNVGSDTLIGPLVSVPAPNHTSYIGLGTITLPMNIQFIAQATTSNGAFAVTPFPILALNPVQLTYDFTPVPEPSSLTLSALLIVGMAARRNRTKRCTRSGNGLRNLS